MRALPPVLVLFAGLAGGAALLGCTGKTTCATNADCPVQSYCVPGDGGAKGTCRRDCEATLDCHDPALRCSSLGQCVAYEIPGFDAGVDAAPEDAAAAPDAGDDAPLEDAGAD